MQKNIRFGVLTLKFKFLIEHPNGHTKADLASVKEWGTEMSRTSSGKKQMMWRTDKESPKKRSIALTSWRDRNKCLFTPKWTIATNQEMILFKSCLSESKSLLSLLTSIWVEEYG